MLERVKYHSWGCFLGSVEGVTKNAAKLKVRFCQHKSHFTRA